MMKKNRNGFSMVELIVALGIGTIVIMVAMFLNKQVDQTTSHMMLKGDVEVSELTIKGIVTKDILNSKPSFGYLSYKGEGVGCATTKYDMWRFDEIDSKCRVEYNMDISVNEVFYLIILKTGNKRRVSEVLIPRQLYSGTKTAAFDTQKFNDFLKVKTKLGQDKTFLKFQLPSGKYTQLIYLQGTGSYSHSKVENKRSLTPFVFSKTLAPHCDINEPANLDEYLRCVPDVGSGTQLLVDPVKIVRYRVEESKKYADKDLMALFRGIAYLEPGGKMVFREIKLTDYLKKLKIVRPDTSSALLNFSVELEKATRLRN